MTNAMSTLPPSATGAEPTAMSGRRVNRRATSSWPVGLKWYHSIGVNVSNSCTQRSSLRQQTRPSGSWPAKWDLSSSSMLTRGPDSALTASAAERSGVVAEVAQLADLATDAIDVRERKPPRGWNSSSA